MRVTCEFDVPAELQNNILTMNCNPLQMARRMLIVRRNQPD